MTESIEREQEETDLFELGQSLLRLWKTITAVTIIVFVAMAVATFHKTPKYQSEMLILMYREASVPSIPGLETTEEPESDQNLSTEIEILKSRSLVAKAITASEISFDDLSTSESVSKVIEKMSIRQAGEADVLMISYQDTSPWRTQAVLEALGSTYIDYSLERQRSQATNAIRFIDEQLPEAQKALDATTSTLRRFQERHGIVEPKAYAEKVAQRQHLLLQEEQQLKVNLSQAQRRAQELRQRLQEAGQRPETTLANSILSQDPYYQELALKLTEIESELASQRAIFRDTDPSIQQLIQQRNQIKALLQERTQSILGVATPQVNGNQVIGYGETYQDLTEQLLEAETELATLENQLQAIRGVKIEETDRFQQVPQLQQAYTELQRQLEVQSEAVNNFLKTRQELSIAEAQEIAPWEIIEAPYLPESPVSPNIKQDLLLGLISGGLLGVGAALLQKRFDRRVTRVKALKQLTGLSLLATIPHGGRYKVGVPLINLKKPARQQQQAFIESLRTLAMNLRYLGAAMDWMKVLALTSAVPGEGKTTITYHLGVILAELGQRVLVIDGDLRQPTLHLLAGIPNDRGLSTVLTSDSAWYSIVQPGEIQGLDLISAGPPPTNPVALLSSKKMQQLIHEWRQTYDHVLLDTTTVAGVADTQTVGSYVDSMIFIAGMDCGTHEEIVHALEVLRRNQCTLAGVVANFVSEKHGHSYSYQESPRHHHSQPQLRNRVHRLF
jgi:succinoglycan biosynthesis transport protein ExoP